MRVLAIPGCPAVSASWMRCITPFLRALSSTTTSLWSLYHPLGVLVIWCLFSHLSKVGLWSRWDWRTSSWRVAKFKTFAINLSGEVVGFVCYSWLVLQVDVIVC